MPKQTRDLCPICLTTLTRRATISSCHHSFCHSCIRRWAQRKPTCPICLKTFHSITRPPRRIRKDRIASKPKRRQDLPSSEADKIESPQTAFLDEEEKMEQEIFSILLKGKETRQGIQLFLGLFGQIESLLEELS